MPSRVPCSSRPRWCNVAMRALPREQLREVERIRHTHAVRGGAPADERRFAKAHDARPAVLDLRAARERVPRPDLMPARSSAWRIVVARLGVEVGVAPAADHETAVRGLVPVLVAVVRVRRALRELDVERLGRDHPAASRRDDGPSAGTSFGVYALVASMSVRACTTCPFAVTSQTLFCQRAVCTALCANSRTPRRPLRARRRAGTSPDARCRPRHFERGVERADRVGGHGVGDRDLAHRETVVTQFGQRAAQVLVLSSRVRESRSEPVCAYWQSRLSDCASWRTRWCVRRPICSTARAPSRPQSAMRSA